MDCDVVVVGAGVAGTAAAAEIGRGGASVVLVEREAHPAHHASGRSASLLNESVGHPVVCALARLSRPFFEDPPEGFSDHPLLSPRGLLWVGGADDASALDELWATAAPTAQRLDRIDAAAVAALLPTFSGDAIAGGGVHEPDAMAIDTAELIAGNLRRLRRAGGELHTTTEAIEVHPSGDGWRVVAGDRTWQARHVVDAAGAWADELAARAGVAPVGLRALRRTAALVPVPPEHDISRWPLVMDVAGHYYCEPETGGLLISPADEHPVEPCDAQPDELDVALAIERVAEASGLPLRSVRRAWAGLRTFAPDRAPVLGEEPTAPGFWWFAGQGGAGIKTAPAMASLLAGMIGGDPFPPGATDLGLTPAALSPQRFR